MLTGEEAHKRGTLVSSMTYFLQHFSYKEYYSTRPMFCSDQLSRSTFCTKATLPGNNKQVLEEIENKDKVISALNINRTFFTVNKTKSALK